VAPGREHAAVEREHLAVCEGDRLARGVERGGGRAEAPLDVEVVEALTPERYLLHLPLAGEELLRQRWTVVGQVGLSAHHDDTAVELEPAQLFGGAQARERCAHDHDGLHRRLRSDIGGEASFLTRVSCSIAHARASRAPGSRCLTPNST
jgi:hypothetical protein